MTLGQFSIFGAIEEISGHGFTPIFTDEEPHSGPLADARDREGFCFHEER
jgi:hypothetical protein